MPPKRTAKAMHTDMYLRGVSGTVRTQFKAACRLQGRTMKEVAVELLKAYTAEAVRLAETADPTTVYAKAAKQVLAKGRVK